MEKWVAGAEPRNFEQAIAPRPKVYLGPEVMHSFGVAGLRPVVDRAVAGMAANYKPQIALPAADKVGHTTPGEHWRDEIHGQDANRSGHKNTTGQFFPQ